MVPVRESKSIAVLAAALLALAAIPAHASELEQKLADAQTLLERAAAADAEWLKTSALLDQAREAAANGDEDTALQLAEKARFQAEAALRQAEREAELWQHRVLR
jgi:acyl-CoA-binding protein